MRPALLLLLFVAAPVSRAEDPAPKPAPKAGEAAPPTTKKAPRAIQLEAITVEGRIQKPEAFYFLDRSKPSFDDLNRTESFVPKVVQSVDQDPF
ncbi:hypothetical protein [Corallococcus sicarius]|uniref:Uncharacterized protein n=1 Tax=Corallococcus sicarius TaxID=2316726 RepID=A0A3A8MLL0_9BACT|nr:hypothetical protein [Corallococcus sicarius]RKH27504.1 hypothetical protein D7X12_40690 [Corallococcus sicarius]